MRTDTHGNGNGLNDLYILPNNPKEKERITNYLKSIDCLFTTVRSDVKGHAWFGLYFIDIPFGEYLESRIREITEV